MAKKRPRPMKSYRATLPRTVNAQLDAAIEEGLRKQVVAKNIVIDSLRAELAAASDILDANTQTMSDQRELASQLREELDRPHRVLRLIEYTGPRRWVEDTVRRAVHGTHRFGNGGAVTGVTLTEYPEVLVLARETDAEKTRAAKTWRME